MDQVDDPGQDIGVGVGRHPMAEVEDVTGQAPRIVQDLQHPPAYGRPWREKHCGIEVSLHGPPRSDPPGTLGQGHPEVHPHDLRTGFAHCPQQLAGPDAEVDPRHPEVAHRGQRGGGVRLHLGQVVGQRQRTDPRVEELHDTGPGLGLHPQERTGDEREPGQQVVPEPRVAVHQGLGPFVTLRGAALDEVRRQRERRSGEPDQRRRPELGHERAHRLGHIGHMLRRQLGQPVQVRCRPEGLGDDRSHARARCRGPRRSP